MDADDGPAALLRVVVSRMHLGALRERGVVVRDPLADDRNRDARMLYQGQRRVPGIVQGDPAQGRALEQSLDLLVSTHTANSGRVRAMRSGSASQSLVEPSTSVKSSVIVPVGIAAVRLTCAGYAGQGTPAAAPGRVRTGPARALIPPVKAGSDPVMAT